MKRPVILLLLMLWSYALSEKCRTPLDKESNCVSIYDCPDLLPLLQRSRTEREDSFLRLSHCGFTNDDTPKVCCSPFTIPEENDQETSVRYSNYTITKTMIKYNFDRSSMDSLKAEDSTPDNNCGLDMNGDRIIGGVETDLDEFPWMALLGFQTSQGTILYRCGGSLINHRFVLTAAHCILGRVQKEIGILKTVRLGEHDTTKDIDCNKKTKSCNGPVQEIPVYIAVTHQGWSDNNRNKRHDIGLVMLARRAMYTDAIKPICLVNADYRLDAGDSVHVAGWGWTLPNGTESEVKLKVQMAIYDKTACAKRYRTQARVLLTPNQICVGGTSKVDTCRGDSGGPLMKMRPNGIWDAVGVVSSGVPLCAEKDWPGLYSSVAGYIDWILSTVKAINENKLTGY